jgi:CheY-like chemotaxis protein
MEKTMGNHFRQESPSTILLVEDFDDTRLMMKMWLVKKGYHVIEAETGEEAVIVAQRELPDLIIMDMMMPGMNGLDATQRIRQYQALRRTPIVAVSAYGVDEYRPLALEAGCDEYVSTPFEPSALSELIETLLASKEPSELNAQPIHVER